MKLRLKVIVLCCLVALVAFLAGQHTAQNEPLPWATRFVMGPSIDRSFYSYTQGAQQGEVKAQFYLGLIYAGKAGAKEEGVETDYVTAYFWFYLAAAQEGEWSVDARTELRLLTKKMAPDQIASAQQLAREWKPQGDTHGTQ